jgi:hypothetical protein
MRGVALRGGTRIRQVPIKLADLQTADIAIAHGLRPATGIGASRGLDLDLIDAKVRGQC